MRRDSVNKNAEFSRLVLAMGCLLTYIAVYKFGVSFSFTMTL